jgi:HD-like signal output (HDOD) protein
MLRDVTTATGVVLHARGELESKVAGIICRLPPLPENIDFLLLRPSKTPAEVCDLVRLIADDPSLCVEFLHLANACGARPGCIETVEEAVADIGIEPLIQLVGASYVNGTVAEQFSELTHLNAYFAHAREIARSARLLADLAELTPHQREMYALAGLIHDLGRLVIMVAMGKTSAPLMGTSWEQMTAIVHSETELLGMNHCDIGKDLIGRWNLSPTLQEGVLRHHSPLLQEDDFSAPGALIFLAHFVASSDLTGEILGTMLPPVLFRRLGLTPAAFDAAHQRFRAPLT